MSDTQADEIKALIKLARKRPLNFGVCLGRKPEETILLMDKRKPPDALGRNAKKEGNSPKVASGTVEVLGKIFAMTCPDPPPNGVAKSLKKFLNSIKVRLKVQVLDPAGNVLEEEDDEQAQDDDAATAQDANAEPSPEQIKYEAMAEKLGPAVEKIQGSKHPNAAKIAAIWSLSQQRAEGGDYGAAITALGALRPLFAPGPAAGEAPAKAAPDALEKWQAATAKIEPRIAPLKDRTDAPAVKVVAAWGKLNAVAEAGQADKALAALPQVIKAIVAVPPSPIAEPPPASETPVDVIEIGTEVRDIWDDATEVTDRQLDALFAKIRSADDAAAAKIADLGLNTWSKGARTAVTKAMIKLNGKTNLTIDAGLRKEAAGAFRAYRQFIGMHPAVKLLEQNAYQLPVELNGTLATALAKMENMVLAD